MYQLIKNLKENDGLTLKKNKSIRYKTGWQVATAGVECHTIEEVLQAIKDFDGNCGIWLEKGIYYVDKCHRVNTKHEGLAIGKLYNQISIYGWARNNLAYC